MERYQVRGVMSLWTMQLQVVKSLMVSRCHNLYIRAVADIPSIMPAQTTGQKTQDGLQPRVRFVIRKQILLERKASN